MKTISLIQDSKIMINNLIDTTLRPIGYYINNDSDYYLNFKVKLDGLIIPIIRSCYAKI